MITLKLLKKKPFVQQVVSVLGVSKDGKPAPNVKVKPSVSSRMDKIDFTKVLEKTKQEFKIGERVAFAGNIPQPHYVPYYFVVSGYQELWYQCLWNDQLLQPELLVVKSTKGHLLYRAPDAMRKLTDEENALADLKATVTQGTA